MVLDGSCGEAECCGVTARTFVSDALVTWFEFAGADPEVVDGLIFVFDRAAYEQAWGAHPGQSRPRLC